MSKSVLIVEDDEILANNIRVYLERDGWEVSVSSSVEKALTMLETVRPDVVVTDYMLPGKSGLDLLREVIAMDPYIKVVMVTGEGSIQVAVDAIRMGAHDYVGKPVVLAELKFCWKGHSALYEWKKPCRFIAAIKRAAVGWRRCLVNRAPSGG